MQGEELRHGFSNCVLTQIVFELNIIQVAAKYKSLCKYIAIAAKIDDFYFLFACVRRGKWCDRLKRIFAEHLIFK